MFMQGGGTELMFSPTGDYETRRGTGVTFAGCVEVHIAMIEEPTGSRAAQFEPQLEVVW
jgi:hypothetical protein